MTSTSLWLSCVPPMFIWASQWLSSKESTCNAGAVGNMGWSLGQEDPWRRTRQPTPVFLPGESMDRGAWWATVHRVAKSWTRLKLLSTHMHIYMLRSGTSECDLTWDQGHSICPLAKTRLLLWALIQSDWYLIKRGHLDTGIHKKGR